MTNKFTQSGSCDRGLTGSEKNEEKLKCAVDGRTHFVSRLFLLESCEDTTVRMKENSDSHVCDMNFTR